MAYKSRPSYINLNDFQKIHLETLKEMWSYQFLKDTVYEAYIIYNRCPIQIKHHLDKEFEKNAFDEAISIIGQSSNNLLSNVFK